MNQHQDGAALDKSLDISTYGAEDDGSGLLNGFQALAEEIGVAMPKLDVVQSFLAQRCGMVNLCVCDET